MKRLPLQLALLLLVIHGCDRTHSVPARHPAIPVVTPGAALPTFLSAVSAATYRFTTTPVDLPRDVVAVLEAESGSHPFRIAAPGQPFNFGCLIDPTLPNVRLVNAAISVDYAVVHYEFGGYAGGTQAIVFGRTANASAVALWRQHTYFRFSTVPEFTSALRDGSLWRARPEENDRRAGA